MKDLFTGLFGEALGNYKANFTEEMYKNFSNGIFEVISDSDEGNKFVEEAYKNLDRLAEDYREVIRNYGNSFIKAAQYEQELFDFLFALSVLQSTINDTFLFGEHNKPLFIKNDQGQLKLVVYVSAKDYRWFTQDHSVNLNVTFAYNGEVKNRVFCIPAAYSITEGFSLIPSEAFPEGEVRELVKQEQAKYQAPSAGEVESLQFQGATTYTDFIKSIFSNPGTIVEASKDVDYQESTRDLKNLVKYKDMDEVESSITDKDQYKSIKFLKLVVDTLEYFWEQVIGPGRDCPVVLTNDNDKPVIRAFVYGPQAFGIPFYLMDKPEASMNLCMLAISETGDYLEWDSTPTCACHIFEALIYNISEGLFGGRFKEVLKEFRDRMAACMIDMYGADNDPDNFMHEDEYYEPCGPTLKMWADFLKDGMVPFGDSGEMRYKLHRVDTYPSEVTPGKMVTVEDDIYYSPDDWVNPWLSHIGY